MLAEADDTGQLSASVTGLEELRRELRKLEDRVGTKVVRAAVRHASKPVIERAKALTPVSSPPRRFGFHLRDSIALKLEKKKDRDSAVQYRLGPQRHPATGQDPAGWKVAGGLSDSSKAPNYAVLVHDRVPFLDRAIEEKDQEFVARAADHLGRSIERGLR